MKKCLLIAAAIATTLCASAENKIYYFDESLDGTVFGVSSNGLYAVGGDEADNIGFVWRSDKPEEITRLENCVCRDASNNGTIVGSMYLTGTYTSLAAYYDGSEWHRLPLSDNIIGESFAMSISSDGKYIGGYQYTYYKDSETGGRYYPCLWTRDDFGDYQLKIYNDIELPDHQGFAVGAVSEDGRVLAGQVFCGFGSLIPALLVDGKFVIFNELETRSEPFYYKGQLLGYYNEYYIDGFHDYSSTDNFYGSFLSIDDAGNIYGMRTKANDVKEDGTGVLTYGGCKYNYKSGEWTDHSYGSRGSAYMCGFNGNYISMNNGNIIVDGTEQDLLTYFGITGFDRQVSGLAAFSSDGTVAGGTSLYYLEASGEYAGQPFFLKLDGLSGVNDIAAETSAPGVIVNGNQIVVTGADNIAVYNAMGQLMSTGSVSSQRPGVYIVRADNKTVKVVVK